MWMGEEDKERETSRGGKASDLSLPLLPSPLPSSLPPSLLDQTRNDNEEKKRKMQNYSLLVLRDEGPGFVDGLERSPDQGEGGDFYACYGDVENQRRHERRSRRTGRLLGVSDDSEAKRRRGGEEEEKGGKGGKGEVQHTKLHRC